VLSFRSLVALAGLAALAAPAASQLHVPSQYPDIQAAIDAARPGDTVLVAPGVYTGAGNRDLSFGGKNIVVRSAGGAATCTLDCQGSFQEPHRGFLFEGDESREARVQGFTIRNASTAQGAILDQFNGGAIRIRNGSSPTIADCVFEGNTAGCWGGGVYAGFGGTPLIMNCRFERNTADDGGGFFSWSGSKTDIRSSVFVRNHAGNAGGAIAEFGGGALYLDHCTIVHNTAGSWSSGGVVDFGFESSIRNSIVWGNTGSDQLRTSAGAVQFSNVQGGFAGEGNINEDPRLRPDGYHLQASSPCINAGQPGFTPVAGETDIDGESRIQNARVDMGADECQPGLILPGLGDVLGSIGIGSGRR